MSCSGGTQSAASHQVLALTPCSLLLPQLEGHLHLFLEAALSTWCRSHLALCAVAWTAPCAVVVTPGAVNSDIWRTMPAWLLRPARYAFRCAVLRMPRVWRVRGSLLRCRAAWCCAVSRGAGAALSPALLRLPAQSAAFSSQLIPAPWCAWLALLQGDVSQELAGRRHERRGRDDEGTRGRRPGTLVARGRFCVRAGGCSCCAVRSLLVRLRANVLRLQRHPLGAHIAGGSISLPLAIILIPCAVRCTCLRTTSASAAPR